MLLVSCLGCKKENPNPELIDPIYLDLSKMSKEKAKELEDAKKALEEAKKEMEKVEPNTADWVVAQRTLKSSHEKIAKLSAQAKYLEIRAEHRKYSARKEYKLAFNAGQTWPDPKQYEAFKRNLRLKNAPRSWGYRVPKLFKENPNYVPPQKQQ